MKEKDGFIEGQILKVLMVLINLDRRNAALQDLHKYANYIFFSWGVAYMGASERKSLLEHVHTFSARLQILCRFTKI